MVILDIEMVIDILRINIELEEKKTQYLPSQTHGLPISRMNNAWKIHENDQNIVLAQIASIDYAHLISICN